MQESRGIAQEVMLIASRLNCPSKINMESLSVPNCSPLSVTVQVPPEIVILTESSRLL